MRRVAYVGAWAIAVLGFVAITWLPPLCPMRLLLHVPCPSCGLTRAMRLALHGDFAGAMRLHPLFWAVGGYVGVLAVLEAVSYVETGRTGRWTRGAFQRGGYVLLVALVLVWVARGLGALGGPAPIE